MINTNQISQEGNYSYHFPIIVTINVGKKRPFHHMGEKRLDIEGRRDIFYMLLKG